MSMQPAVMSKLTVRDVKKSYGPSKIQALKGVSFETEGNQIVALLGRSGSGKSTLLRCINRLVQPDSGEIVFDGVDVTRLSPRELREMRRQIGMVFQEFNLVNRLSVIDNVLCGRASSTGIMRCMLKVFPKQDVRRAEELLEMVGLAAHRYKRADELSGGQRQRVGIARALMQNPRLILADEPTASLDPAIGREIMGLICGLARSNGIPVLISMHDVQLAKEFVERVIALRGGEKVFDGPPSAADFRSIYTVVEPTHADGGEPDIQLVAARA
jgi:phosphonate transport system ATP-binding protein